MPRFALSICSLDDPEQHSIMFVEAESAAHAIFATSMLRENLDGLRNDGFEPELDANNLDSITVDDEGNETDESGIEPEDNITLTVEDLSDLDAVREELFIFAIAMQIVEVPA